MTEPWWSCDGQGGEGSAPPPLPAEDRAAPAGGPAWELPVGKTTRRTFLGLPLLTLPWRAFAKAPAGALHRVALAPRSRPAEGDILVVLFLRGAADGLNIVVPYGEDAYHRLRPTLGLAPPGDRRKESKGRTLDLNGFFGLHPALAPLLPLYREGLLSFVHACGSWDQTRSHFEAMGAMERGQGKPGEASASGWLARCLETAPRPSSSPLRALALTPVMPDSLRGATDATALPSLDAFRLQLPPGWPAPETDLHATLAALYGGHSDPVSRAGQETLDALASLRRIDLKRYRPANGAAYPQTSLGEGLRQVAALIRSRVGLEIAFLDRGGWDTHVAQGTVGGWLASQLEDLGGSLAAFLRDLGPEADRVTVVAMTEFGRRAHENSGLGTDHGRGSVMMLLGGGIVGGRVFAQWPGLEPGQLEPPGDLRVTTDYRDVLAEIVALQLNNPHLETVFPGLAARYPGVTKPVKG